MRVVLDTSVVIAALRSVRGASNKLLELAAQRRFELVATPALFLEYEDVLSRPEQRSAARLDPSNVDAILADLASLITPVKVYFRWRPQLTDAGDELVLEAAINGMADCLVTHNVRHLAPACMRFKLPVFTPRQALQELLQ